jgi:hypothetical protein
VCGAYLVVAHRADDERAGDPQPAKRETEQVDRALVGPVQVIDDEDARL